MTKPSDPDDWDARRTQIVGLGERSFHKSYYPQLRQNLERLERFHTLLDRTTDFVILITLPEGVISDANAALGRLLGQPLEALLEQPLATLGLENSAAVLDILRQDMDSPAEPPSHTLTCTFTPPDGSTRWLDFSYRVAVVDARPYGVLVGRDVSDKKQHQEMLEALLSEKEALLDNAVVGILMVRQRRIVSCNRRFCEMFAIAREQLIGQSTQILYEAEERFTAFAEEGYRQLATGHSFSTSSHLRRHNGESFWCEITGQAIDPRFPREGSIWIFNDISERKKAEEQASFLVHYDALTGLPNHLLLQDRLQQAIAFAHRDGMQLAFIAVDIDRFKSVNEFLGHAAGDGLLVEVAQRLKDSIRASDTLSRQGGDEFILLLTDLAEPDAVITFLGGLLAAFQAPFRVEGQEISLSLSLGTAIYPGDGTDFSTLRRKADMALYRAKEAGRNSYRFYNDEMNDAVVEQMTMHSGLRQALENGQFVLYYQPQVEISSGRLSGAEALIRWQHPDLDLVAPGRFIPVAEDTGLIVDIGHWVLHQACREAARWRQAGLLVPQVAVNLSALQFKHGNIEDSVTQALADSGLDPSMLELELTESILIGDTENVLTTVKRLKHMGLRLSIDDFGTGYSSLSYLKRFQVDKLKIDQSFIRNLASSAEDAAIVRAIIQMARSFGLRTIAEGVENEQVLALLRLYRCDEAQGYHHARPLPAEDFLRYATNAARAEAGA